MNRLFQMACLASALGVASFSASAEVIVHMVNKSHDDIQFSLMVPRTKIYSQLDKGLVTEKSNKRFVASELLESQCQQRRWWRCSKLMPVIQKYGNQVIFVTCPKVYNSRHRKVERWYQIKGNDSSNITCRSIRKPRQQTTPT